MIFLIAFPACLAIDTEHATTLIKFDVIIATELLPILPTH